MIKFWPGQDSMEIKNDSKAKEIIVIVEKAQKCKVIHLEHTGVCLQTAITAREL